MNRIEPLAARIPYMTCVGNHEVHGNFSHYRFERNLLFSEEVNVKLW